MRACEVRVAAVIFYGYDLRVQRTLASECPLCRGCMTPVHVRWVAWRYCVQTRGEPRLLVCAGGGGGCVVVSGDEVQQGPWGVEGHWTAVPARARCTLVILPHGQYIGLQVVVFGDGPGSVVSLDGGGQ